MKKVFILGAEGFIGRHPSRRILETTDGHVDARRGQVAAARALAD